MNNIVSKYFPSVSAKQWKQKIQYLLEGKNYQTLVQNSIDGISTLPFYTKEEQPEKDFTEHKSTPKPTYYCIVSSVEKANLEALNAIENGINTIYFALFDSKVNLDLLLKNIDVEIIIQCYFLDSKFVKQATITTKNCIVLYDCLGKVSKTGNWYQSAKEDFSVLNNCLSANQNNISINISNLHNAGASPVQQLSYALSQLITYSKKISLNQQNTITYIISVSTDIYIEIAKIKTLRILHQYVAKTLHLNTNCNIIQYKSKRNLSGILGAINKIDTATERHIALLAGVDYFTTTPNNYYFYKEDIPKSDAILTELKSSISNLNNTLIVGSIYIEKLTEQLLEKSTLLIETLEKGGGYIEQLKKGTIQQKIASNEATNTQNLLSQTEFDESKNSDFKSNTPISFPFLKRNKRKTLWQPIIEKQWRASLELPIWKKTFDI